MSNFDVSGAFILAGVPVGSLLPYPFSALTMISVGKAAAEMIEEVRHQFREVTNAKGVTFMEAIRKATNGVTIAPEDDVEPDSDRCVMLSTRSSVKEMIALGMYAVLTPLIAGFMVGGRTLMGLLAGTDGRGKIIVESSARMTAIFF